MSIKTMAAITASKGGTMDGYTKTSKVEKSPKQIIEIKNEAITLYCDLSEKPRKNRTRNRLG